MNVSMPTLLMLFVFVWIYTVIIDFMKDLTLGNAINQIFGNFTNTTYSHSLYGMAKNHTATFATGATTLVTSLLSSLPVS